MSASPADALVEAVRSALASSGDPVRAAAQQRYMKSALPFRGLSSPERRALLRPVLAAHVLDERADLERAVRRLWDEAAFREEWYAAIAVLRHRPHRAFLDPEALGLLHHLVSTGAWWDVVDELAQHGVGAVLLRHRSEASPVVLGWASADDLWVRRTAILCQNRHRRETDLGLLGSVLDANLEGSPYGTEFFIRKAIGWALRSYAYTDADWVRRFVDQHRESLSGLSIREATKHLG